MLAPPCVVCLLIRVPPLHLSHFVCSALGVAERNPGSAPIVMLSLRLLANLHVHSGSRRLLAGSVASRALGLASAHAASANKSIRVCFHPAALDFI